MPAVLKKIDKEEYGTIPKSCNTHALVSMIHNWHVSSDGNEAAIRVVLFDFRKAVRKLSDYDKLFRTTSYAGLLTFYWIEDRELNWPRIASPSGVTSLPVFLRGQSLGRGSS